MIRTVLLCTAVLAGALASSGMAYTNADLLFSVNHNDLGSNGSVIDTWGIFSKTGATGYSPTVETLTDAGTGIAVNWAKPAAGVLTDPTPPATPTTSAGGSGFTSGIYSSIENTGFTIVMAIRPDTNTGGSTEMRSLVNIYFGGVALLMKDSGTLAARLQSATATTAANGSNTTSTDSALKLADDTPIVVSMVVSSTGLCNVWAGSQQFITNFQGAGWPYASLLPSVKIPAGTPPAYTLTNRTSIGLGSPGGPVTGTTIDTGTFRGYIGDTYVYNTAFTNDERLALVSTVESNMGMVAVPEPASIVALILGLGSLAGLSRRRR